jgi:hypothetical protein
VTDDVKRPQDLVLRTPGAPGRPEDTREVITSTQTSSGIGGGDPQGGPRRTPEREHFDAARPAGHPHDPQAGETAGVHAGDPVRPDDAVASTPPHGDDLLDDRD